MTNPCERIIWSADLSSEGELRSCLRAMPDLLFVKIDRLLVDYFGPRMIDRIQDDFGVKVFDDAKLVEIPSKLQALAEMHLAHRPWMLNCMAGCVSSGILSHEDPEKEVDGLKRFADACHAVGTLPCGVTVLTSKTSGTVVREFNRAPIDQVLYYVGILQECGFTDIVCSAREVAAIRSESRFDGLSLNTPGIRPAGSAAGDQARCDTPEAALAARATRLVIGRPITTGNPAENLRRICDQIYLAGIKASIPPGQASHM